MFYPYSIPVNKWNGSCNNINNPYWRLWPPNVVKNINVKVFNLVSRTNERRHMISATLNDYESVCNSCTIYIALFVIAFLIIIGISSAFIYFHWYLKKVMLLLLKLALVILAPKKYFIKHINGKCKGHKH